MSSSFTFILANGQKIHLDFNSVAIAKLEDYFDCPFMYLHEKPTEYMRLRGIVEVIYLTQRGSELSREEILQNIPIKRIGDFFFGLFKVLQHIFDVKNLPAEMQK